MKYDFTSILDRRGRDAIAVDGLGRSPGFAPDAPQPGFDAIPMWVADMNFATVPAIPAALAARAAHPAYGYFETSDAWYDAIIGWQADRNGCVRRHHRLAGRPQRLRPRPADAGVHRL